MNQVQKLLFISLLIIISNSLFAQNYNYKDTIIYIPESEIIYLKNGIILDEPFYFSEEKIRHIPITILNPVQLSISNIYTHILKRDNRMNHYDNEQLSPSLYYLGIVPINLAFESYIFMTDNNSPSPDAYTKKEFYMLNIQKERLVSIYKIASYMLDWGHVFHSYTILNRQMF